MLDYMMQGDFNDPLRWILIVTILLTLTSGSWYLLMGKQLRLLRFVEFCRREKITSRKEAIFAGFIFGSFLALIMYILYLLFCSKGCGVQTMNLSKIWFCTTLLGLPLIFTTGMITGNFVEISVVIRDKKKTN